VKNRQKQIIDQLSDQELLLNFYISQALIFFIAIVLSFFLFPDILDVFQLFDFSNMNSILIIGGGAGMIVVFIDFLLMKFLPSTYFDDGGINERLFTNRGVVPIIFMTLLVAFCEELLFRGVLQTKFGLVTASVIFALVHFRYLFNKFLFFDVILLSFFIGFIYEWTGNLAVSFFMHFVIDCLLGLFIYFKNLLKQK
jgi:hypothetical protein